MTLASSNASRCCGYRRCGASHMGVADLRIHAPQSAIRTAFDVQQNSRVVIADRCRRRGQPEHRQGSRCGRPRRGLRHIVIRRDGHGVTSAVEHGDIAQVIRGYGCVDLRREFDLPRGAVTIGLQRPCVRVVIHGIGMGQCADGRKQKY